MLVLLERFAEKNPPNGKQFKRSGKYAIHRIRST